MKVLDLFSGIGGFSLGLERAGMETVAFCEFDKHAQKVLQKHWPDLPIHDDVRTLDGYQYRGSVDVVCGGFPCQDISVAGKQKGIEAERSGLWAECARLLGEVRPRYAIFENVTALISGDEGRWFQRVLWDISEVGYDAEWHCISASELGAHHHRDRVWIICYPKHPGSSAAEITESYKKRNGSDAQRTKPASESARSGDAEILADSTRRSKQALLSRKLAAILRETYQKRQTRRLGASGRYIGAEWAAEPNVGRVANGIPNRSHRLKQLGNAVVPQIPEIIGRAIMEVEA